MTFEYRDTDGCRLHVAHLDASTYYGNEPVVALMTEHRDGDDLPVVYVPLDRVEEVVAGIRDAARQAAGQTARDCPACDAGIEHTEHCPTPETHNWGCGCPTDKAPAAAARQALASYMGGWGNDPTLALLLNDYHFAIARETRAAVEQPAEAQPADLLAECATEYHVPVPEGGGTNLLVRRQALVHGTGWSVCTRAHGGGRAWTTEGWQESISALSVDRLFCWPDPATAVDEARRALATTP